MHSTVQYSTVHMYSDQNKKLTLCRMSEKEYIKEDIDDNSDGAHLTSLGMEFQTEEEAQEVKRSPSVTLLCAGLLRRGVVYQLERVCAGFFLQYIE